MAEHNSSSSSSSLSSRYSDSPQIPYNHSSSSPSVDPRSSWASSCGMQDGRMASEETGSWRSTLGTPRPLPATSLAKQSSKPPPSNMDAIPWYHHNLSRHVAESLLISTGRDGSYLLRNSGSNPGEYTLSVRSKNAVKHFPVRWDGSHFTFGFGKFSSVEELMEHFDSKPVIGGDSGILTLLKFPYPRCVEEPDVYDSIRVHAEGGVTEQNEQPVFAIASKEGYLTKLGQRRKNWKQRWFVLYKNELSYFKSKEEKIPIRTIDLKDVSNILSDSSQGRENCFKVLASYRTFFLVASTAQEASDWIRILRWKLEHPSGLETLATVNNTIIK